MKTDAPTAANATPTRPQAKAPQVPIDVAALFPEFVQISDPALRQSVADVWQELWSQSSYTDIGDVPVSPEIPVPTLPHNQCVVRMALAMATEMERTYPIDLNRDYLIASAILQDASKVVEYTTTAAGEVEFTDIGRDYPHAFMASHVAIKKGIPPAVVHILLTHSPQSPKFPLTLEGKILYYADQMSVIGVFKDRWRKELFITK